MKSVKRHLSLICVVALVLAIMVPTVFAASICYRAKYNVRTDYAALYEKMLTLGAFIDARNGIVEMKNQDMDSRNPQKVFLIFYFYDTGGFPICYDDYVLMNYGYVT